MNTEPPTGDDLEQMLVAMKRTVLTRAAEQRPQPRRRGRRAGIVIGVIAAIGIGATSGGVALGMIPQPFTAAPAPAPTPTEPAETPTRSSAPVVEEPSATPTPTSTKQPYALDDPSTWTISGNEFGPIALGGATDGETDDLSPTYTHDPEQDVCASEFGSGWARDGVPSLTVWSSQGQVIGVREWTRYDVPAPTAVVGPTTARGIGIGSTLDELRAAYPDAVKDPERSMDAEPTPPPNGYTSWRIDAGVGPTWFGLDQTGTRVATVDIGMFSQVSCD